MKFENDIEKIKYNAKISESMLVGYLYNDFNLLVQYHDKINEEDFIHKEWKFFFELIKYIVGNKYKKVDDIAIQKSLVELNWVDKFDEYGGYDTIERLKSITDESQDNIEKYHDDIKRNGVIKKLQQLIGDKIFTKNGNYNYEVMGADEILAYWTYQITQISLSIGGKYDVQNLITNADEYLKELEEEQQSMIPLHNSKYLNKLIGGGLAKGNLTMLGGYGNSGKSTFITEKFIYSCIKNNEHLLAILNEENGLAFRHKLIALIIFQELNEWSFDRGKLIQGGLTDEEIAIVRKAWDKVHELTEGDNSLIKVAFLENYNFQDLENIVKTYHLQGYENLLIDTHKSEDDIRTDRWIALVEMTKKIYKLIRKDGGGLNITCLVSLQLSDSSIGTRFLDFSAISEAKAMKNEASVMIMFRNVFADELENGKNELKCWKWVSKTEKEEFTLKAGKTYSLFFLPKNRFGANSSSMECPVIVMENNFKWATFKEIGYTYVPMNSKF